MTTEAYPLQWPEGWPKSKYREDARFKTTFAKARDELFNEIRLLGGTLPVLSTNVELRRDGLPYANRIPSGSSGVAMYFTYKKKPMSFACDKYFRVQDNIQAIRKTIGALRGIERWGASDMLERAFTGFEALPDQTNGAWWAVLCVPQNATRDEVESAYKQRRKAAHPDKCAGSHDQFIAVQEAWQQYRIEDGII